MYDINPFGPSMEKLPTVNIGKHANVPDVTVSFYSYPVTGMQT
jgi:hypothetical protein